jgi:signal peptidase I
MESFKITKSQAKRSSSETLLKRSAPETEWNELWNGSNDSTDLFSEMIEETLNRGHSIRFSAPGDSMYPTICDGDLIAVEPIKPAAVMVGDIILYQHKSKVTVHRVMHILKRSERNSRSVLQGPQDRSLSETLEFVFRGDAAISDDDPVSSEQILGKVVSIERNGRQIDPYHLRIKLRYKTRRLASHIKRSFLRPDSRPA